MKAYTLFQEYIWLANTLHRFRRLTLEETKQKWMGTDMIESIPIARITFNCQPILYVEYCLHSRKGYQNRQQNGIKNTPHFLP